MGVSSGCGCKEDLHIDFLILLIPSPFLSALFCSSIPTFCSLKNFFRSCSRTFFCNLCNNFFVQHKHIWVTTVHILRWTSAVCLQGAGCRSRSRGVRYIEMHCRPHMY